LQYKFVIVPNFTQITRLVVDEVVNKRLQTIQLGIPLLNE